MNGERSRWRFSIQRSAFRVSRLLACLLLGGLALYWGAQPEAVRSFPETGHRLRGRFLTFWEQHDGRARPSGAWPLRFRDGAAALSVVGRGALGPHPAIVLVDQQIAGGRSALFTLDAQTSIQTGQARFDTLYPQVREFMRHDVTA